ncbi:hypothetical protein H5410_060750 [Solanum commersonii]|uniref:Uncharacterized protein n=1 Tax=Solanum commersonii TaxID=4109 RepID=A0A9J5W716_SOLCO|nr:hypothetical protein H5410_060750 [Solanum commersonii]
MSMKDIISASIDGSGSTTAFIFGDLVEELLSTKEKDIFDTTYVKNQLLRVDQTQQMLSKRLFHIQLRKSSWTNSNVTQSNLTILTSKRSIKRDKSFDASKLEMKATFFESESSSSGTSIEPPMPIKKL